MTTPLSKSYICARCLSKRHLSRRTFATAASTETTSAISTSQLPPAPPSSGASRLSNRRVITLHGVDAAKFLQGLITNDVLKESRNGYFAAFLNAQGKVLNDAFIYPIADRQSIPEGLQTAEDEPAFLIDVDATTTEQLLQVLKRHKLRSKLKFRALDDGELDVWSIWREEDRWTAHGQQTNPKSLGVSLQDMRAPGMGQRLLLPRGGEAKDTAIGSTEQVPLSVYTLRRYLRGVAEGEDEIPRGESLPMNHNLDLTGAIDFKKGCYSGQELTIRTHHTGVVRRRILPIALYDTDGVVPDHLEYEPASTLPGAALRGNDIRRDDERKRATGSVIAAIGNVGLGMCRLEQMSDLVVSGEGAPFDPASSFFVEGGDGERYGVKAFVPEWMKGKIRAPKLQRRVE